MMMISNYININTDEGRAKVKTWKCDKVLHLFTTVCTIFYARSFCPGVDEIVLVVTIVLLVQSVVHIGFSGGKTHSQDTKRIINLSQAWITTLEVGNGSN